jgi:nucleotide-binding universal stress UspA family protein|tara:strand:+ start:106017 stop:106454 length:438 start_codon:yes stop_codon:yes gene_type:complete
VKNILYLVAVDGSDCSLRAADRAVNLAKQTHASVTFLTVKDWSYLQPMVLEGAAPIILDQAAEELHTRTHVLVPLIEKYQDSDLEIKAELVWGDPSSEIQTKIKELRANMLFIGRQGRSRIADILLGSIANKLAHQADIPIVLVP